MTERTSTLFRRACTSLLALLAACGGRYDIGGITDDGRGGTTSLQGASGGMNLAGTRGGVASGGASASPGVTATSGAPSDGDPTTAPLSPLRSENVTCATHVGDPIGPTSTQDIDAPTIAARINTFLFDGQYPDIMALSSTLSRDTVSQFTASAILSGPTPAPGIVRFMRQWLELGTDANGVAAATAATMIYDGHVGVTTLGDLVGPGILTNPALNRVRTGISERGNALLSALFCADVGPVPPGITALPPVTGLTRRQQLEADTTPSACVACHELTDPLGDSLEIYDEQGMLRSTYSDGLPVDASGVFTTPAVTFPTPLTLTFSSIEDLAPQFADSCEVLRCFVRSYTNEALDSLGLPHLSDDELDWLVGQVAPSDVLFQLIPNFVRTDTFLE